MKKLFLLAWPIALAAVSCSNEEVVSVNNDANEIKFAVTAENGTRAQNLFCNLNKPTNFHVWASVGDGEAAKQYFANVSYNLNDGKYTAADGVVHFWPAEAVDFFAVTEETKKAVETPASPAEYNAWTTGFTWNITSASTITWGTRNKNASAQTDLLYAYTRKSRAQATDGTVDINFRHALSQIVFKAVNNNPTIKVEIDQVEVVNIASQGTFTMPFGVDKVTNDNINDHTTAGEYKTGVGSWSGQGTPITYDTEKFTLATVEYNKGVKNLTDEVGKNATGSESEGNYVAAEHPIVKHSLLLIPQKTTAWNRATETAPTSSNGSYFKVYCKIWNVSGATSNGADLLLWGKVNGSGESVTYTTEPVYIPFEANWLPGKKYIYTFNFNTSTTGGYEEDGDPVLVPISFNITVDDFANVTNKDIDMK